MFVTAIRSDFSLVGYVVNSFEGIGRRGRWKYVYGQTSTTRPGVVRQQLAKDGLSLIIF